MIGANEVDFISGNNGTIDGQGALWWDKFHAGKLKYTRPYLIEIMYSENVEISHLTLVNSPSWNVHPVYSRFSPFFFQLTTGMLFAGFCYIFWSKQNEVLLSYFSLGKSMMKHVLVHQVSSFFDLKLLIAKRP